MDIIGGRRVHLVVNDVLDGIEGGALLRRLRHRCLRCQECEDHRERHVYVVSSHEPRSLESTPRLGNAEGVNNREDGVARAGKSLILRELGGEQEELACPSSNGRVERDGLQSEGEIPTGLCGHFLGIYPGMPHPETREGLPRTPGIRPVRLSVSSVTGLHYRKIPRATESLGLRDDAFIDSKALPSISRAKNVL